MTFTNKRPLFYAAKTAAIVALIGLNGTGGNADLALGSKSFQAPCRPANSTDPALRNYRSCTELFAFNETSGAFLGSGTYGKFTAGAKAAATDGATNLSISQQVHQRIAQQIELLYGWGSTVDPVTNASGQAGDAGYYGIEMASGKSSANGARLSKIANLCMPAQPVQALGGAFLSKAEKEENHAGEDCGTSADVTVDMEGTPTFHLSEKFGTLEKSYFKGGRVQALSCFYQKIMKQITEAAVSDRPSITVSEGCIAQAEGFFASGAGDCQQSGVGDDAQFKPLDRCFEKEGRAIDVSACPKDASEQQNFDNTYSDQGQRKIACQKIRAARGSLEAGFALITKCEISHRAERAYRKHIGDSKKQEEIIQKINDKVYPTCDSRCRPLAPNMAAVNQCTTDCWEELGPPEIINEIERLWPSDASQCTEAGFNSTWGYLSFAIIFLTLLSGITGRGRRLTAMLVVCAMAVGTASSLTGCGGKKSGGDTKKKAKVDDKAKKATAEPSTAAADTAELQANKALEDAGTKSVADIAALKLPDASGTTYSPSPAPSIVATVNSDTTADQAAAIAGTTGTYQVPNGTPNTAATPEPSPTSSFNLSATTMKTGSGSSSGGASGGGSGTGNASSEYSNAAITPATIAKVQTDNGQASYGGGGSGSRSSSGSDYASLFGGGSGGSSGSSGGLSFAGDGSGGDRSPASSPDDPTYFSRMSPSDDIFKEVSLRYGQEALRWAQQSVRPAGAIVAPGANRAR